MNWTFWYNWPSWIVELISGTVTNFGARALLAFTAYEFNVDINTWSSRLLLSVILSYVYERVIDKRGWNNDDFEQRATGIGVGEILFDALKVLR